MLLETVEDEWPAKVMGARKNEAREEDTRGEREEDTRGESCLSPRMSPSRPLLSKRLLCRLDYE